jgi:signal transduction histidine kinase
MSVGSTARRFPVALPRFARGERDRVVAGVAAGAGETLDVDPTLVRLALALLAFASGAGIVAYLGAWALLPAPGEPAPARPPRLVGALLLVWSAVLTLRGVGLSDSVVWPLALAAAGLALLGGLLSIDLTDRRARVLGVALVAVGTALFIERNTHGSETTLIAPGAPAIALLLVVGPWAWRVSRERDGERAERIRTQERADLAARVHDSVLQTLALIQREPDDPRRVATLARRQERELRAWLYPEREPAAPGTLAGALESTVAEIEELHGVRVELVRTGDVPADERVRALVLAAREALVNAAKHAGVDELSVFVEATPERVGLYVRDRGSGFDAEAVAADRRGIAESIRGRMERVGGTARIVSSPGEGTEVELELPGAAS